MSSSIEPEWLKKLALTASSFMNWVWTRSSDKILPVPIALFVLKLLFWNWLFLSQYHSHRTGFYIRHTFQEARHVRWKEGQWNDEAETGTKIMQCLHPRHMHIHWSLKADSIQGAQFLQCWVQAESLRGQSVFSHVIKVQTRLLSAHDLCPNHLRTPRA